MFCQRTKAIRRCCFHLDRKRFGAAQLWSENFEGDQSDLFALQDQVTTLVGNSIGREIVIVAARESETRKSSPKVADLMLRARALNLKSQTLKNLQQEEDLYRQALALEPRTPG